MKTDKELLLSLLYDAANGYSMWPPRGVAERLMLLVSFHVPGNVDMQNVVRPMQKPPFKAVKGMQDILDD